MGGSPGKSEGALAAPVAPPFYAVSRHPREPQEAGLPLRRSLTATVRLLEASSAPFTQSGSRYQPSPQDEDIRDRTGAELVSGRQQNRSVPRAEPPRATPRSDHSKSLGPSRRPWTSSIRLRVLASPGTEPDNLAITCRKAPHQAAVPGRPPKGPPARHFILGPFAILLRGPYPRAFSPACSVPYVRTYKRQSRLCTLLACQRASGSIAILNSRGCLPDLNRYPRHLIASSRVSRGGTARSGAPSQSANVPDLRLISRGSGAL